MKKLLPLGALAAVAIAIPAYAAKPSDPGSQGKSHQNTTKSKRCKHSTLTKAYVFGGTLTGNPTLEQTQGQTTPNTTSDDRFNVTLDITVTHANKLAKGDHAKGSTFSSTLQDVTVKLGENTDTSQRTPQSGDHVTIHARQAFKVKRNCTADANAPVGSTSYKSVNFGDQPTTTP